MQDSLPSFHLRMGAPSMKGVQSLASTMGFSMGLRRFLMVHAAGISGYNLLFVYIISK